MRIPASAAVIAACFAFSGARAEIGAVGSPHDSDPAPERAADAPTLPPGWWETPLPPKAEESSEDAEVSGAASGGASEEEKPLLEVNFSRNHVYFERALATGVKAAEAARPGVMYEVISYAPAARGTRVQNERINRQSASEVRTVVENLRAQGVQESRIRVSTYSYAPDEQPPEHHRVSIFVK